MNDSRSHPTTCPPDVPDIAADDRFALTDLGELLVAIHHPTRLRHGDNFTIASVGVPTPPMTLADFIEAGGNPADYLRPARGTLGGEGVQHGE